MTTVILSDGDAEEELAEDVPELQENKDFVAALNRFNEEREELFIGEGLADNSVCSVASVCNSVTQLGTEEDAIDVLFNTCDTSGMGQVSVSSLLERMKVFIDSEGNSTDLDTWDLEDLWTMFDANGMDIVVDLETCREVMAKWVYRVRQTSGFTPRASLNCSDLIEFSPGTPPSYSPISNDVSVRSTCSPAKSSCGVVELPGVANCTFGSLEGNGGDLSALDEIELMTEISELQFQNKKLQEQLIKLRTQVASTEDQNIHLLSERDDLIKKLDGLQMTIERNRDIEKESLELRNCVARIEEAHLTSAERIEQLGKDNYLLESRLRDFREDLKFAYSDLEEAKASRDQLQQSFEEEKLKFEINEEEVKLSKLIREQQDAKILELETCLSDCMKLAKDLQFEKHKLENKLSRALDECARTQQQLRCLESKRYKREDAPFCSPAIRNPCKRPKFEHCEEPTSIVNSTKTTSLHDELQTLVQQNANLPTPFCEKPIRLLEGAKDLSDGMLSRSRSLESCVRRHLFQKRHTTNGSLGIDGDEGVCSRESEYDDDEGSSGDDESASNQRSLCVDAEYGNEKDSGLEIEFNYAMNPLAVSRLFAHSVRQLTFQLLAVMVDWQRGESDCTSPPLPQLSGHAPWTEIPSLEGGRKACKEKQEDVAYLQIKRPLKDQKHVQPSHVELAELWSLFDLESDVDSNPLNAECQNAVPKALPTIDTKDHFVTELSIISQQLARVQAILSAVMRRSSATTAAVAAATAINLPFVNLKKKGQVCEQLSCDTSQPYMDKVELDLEHNVRPSTQFNTFSEPETVPSSKRIHLAKTQSLDQGRSSSPTPVHRRCHHLTVSCPVLPSQTSLVSKGTQTDLCWATTAKVEHLLPVFPQGEPPLKQEVITREAPVSPDVRRQRSNSFLTAVHDGNPHFSDCALEVQQATVECVPLDVLPLPDFTRENCHGPRKLSILPEEDHEDSHSESTCPSMPLPHSNLILSRALPIHLMPPPYRPPPPPSLSSLSRSNPQLSHILPRCFPTRSLEDLHFDQAGSRLSRTFSVPHSTSSVEMPPPLQNHFSFDHQKSCGLVDEKSLSGPRDVLFLRHMICTEESPVELQKLTPADQAEERPPTIDGKEDSRNIICLERRESSRRHLAFAGSVAGSFPLIRRSPAVELDEPEVSHPKASLPSSTFRASRALGTFKNRSSQSRLSTSSLMPDLEASETESARGSGGSMESEPELQPLADGSHMIGSPLIEEVENGEVGTSFEGAFPSLSRDTSSKKCHRNFFSRVEHLNEEEIENEFQRLALAIRSDRTTVHKRLDLHQRQRDLAEGNVERELRVLKNRIQTLELDVLAKKESSLDGEFSRLLKDLLQRVDVIERTTARVSARSEVYGAIQQEERVGHSVVIMVQHVENVKKQCERLQNEILEMRDCTRLCDESLLKLTASVGASPKSVLLNMHPALGRRRASVAVDPRSSLGGALGWCICPKSPDDKCEGPRTILPCPLHGVQRYLRRRSSSATLSPIHPVTDSNTTLTDSLNQLSKHSMIEQEEDKVNNICRAQFSQEAVESATSSLCTSVTANVDSESAISFCQERDVGGENVAADAGIVEPLDSSFLFSDSFPNLLSCEQEHDCFEEKDDYNDDAQLLLAQPVSRCWSKQLRRFRETETFTCFRYVAVVLLVLAAIWSLLSSFLLYVRSSEAARINHNDWISWEEIIRPYLNLRHHSRPPT